MRDAEEAHITKLVIEQSSADHCQVSRCDSVPGGVLVLYREKFSPSDFVYRVAFYKKRNNTWFCDWSNITHQSSTSQ